MEVNVCVCVIMILDVSGPTGVEFMLDFTHVDVRRSVQRLHVEHNAIQDAWHGHLLAVNLQLMSYINLSQQWCRGHLTIAILLFQCVIPLK